MSEEVIRMTVVEPSDIQMSQESMLKGDKGDPFTYEDFTPEQLERLRGPQGVQGDPFTYDDFTPAQLEALRGPQGEQGKAFAYGDFTAEQLEGLRGPQGVQGEPFTYSDFTAEQLENLRGPQGLQGKPFTYSDFTDEQLEALRGPQGIQGVPGKDGKDGTSLYIEDTYLTLEALKATFPTGNDKMYIVSADSLCYIWSETVNDWISVGQLQGPKGDPFTYSDFTTEQLAALKGEPFTYDDFTPEQLESLRGPQGMQGEPGQKGDPFIYSDFTPEQLAALKGDPFTYDDFTAEQLESIRGPQGIQGKTGQPGPKGDPLTYDSMTQTEKDSLVDSVVIDMGNTYATKEYVDNNGGKIDSISVYGSAPLPINNKNVNLELSNVKLIKWGENDTSDTIGTTETGVNTVYIGPSKLSDLESDAEHRTVSDSQIQQWNNAMSISYPTLSSAQKIEMKTLMDAYHAQRSSFIYDGSFRRESYAYPNSVSSLNGSINGCKYGNTYILNCGLFAQMIWMGRSIDDFEVTPTTTITKAFDWGYYFDFTAAKRAYGVMKDASTYYSGNSYANESGGTSFVTFDNAAAMGQELYRKGFDIPYGKVDIGDLVFYRSRSITDGNTDTLEQTSFKYITHVAIVYDVTEDGPIVIESTNAFTSAIGKSGLSTKVTKFGNVRGADLENRVVMAARHPAAFGVACNVPAAFSVYRGTEVQS